MVRYARHALLTVAGGLIAAACGDSTGPKAESSQAFARHVDSLAAAASPSSIRRAVLGIAKFSAALGASPGTVTVTTGAGTQRWHGLVSKTTDPNHHGFTDSNYVLAAWSDDNLTNVVTAELLYVGGQSYETGGFLADTVGVQADSTTVVVTTASVGGPCTAATGLSNTTYFLQFVPDCHLDTFTASITVTVPATAGVDPGFQTITIAAQPFSGASVVLP